MEQQTLFELDTPGGNGSTKALGAFYTDAAVAEFLVRWAVRTRSDRVLDPSFGGGVFLRAACRRLSELGGQPSAQVFGVEIDPGTHSRVAGVLQAEFAVPGESLLLTDFFRLAPASLPRVEAVVGNPPFIRYQRFSGEARQRGLRCSAREGVRLPELCSSWAPFLVHGIAVLGPGGRLAMVVPREIAHARYALPVVQHLRRSFRRVTFVTFRKKLFPDLSEDTLLLLAEGKGEPFCEFLTRDLAESGLLAAIPESEDGSLPRARRLDAEALAQGRERLIEYLIPRTARELYRRLKQLPQTARLGTLADVGIGYVTGANDFFHLDPAAVRRWGIPEAYLRRAVRRGKAFSGLRFTEGDWGRAVEAGDAGFLLLVGPDGVLPESLRRYLAHGESQGVPRAYKCRSRQPWYRVPHVYLPHAFLTYMSGVTPRLVANAAGAVAPNTLHVVRLHAATPLTGHGLAALWQTSLTRLSAEIEGHALGGGMLKLEPTEAENVLLPRKETQGRLGLEALAAELDELMRTGKAEAAQARADTEILQKSLGLDPRDCNVLRRAAETLRDRRYFRSPRA